MTAWDVSYNHYTTISQSLSDSRSPISISCSPQTAPAAHVHLNTLPLHVGTARTEASLKMAIDDSIFDDLIGDTARIRLP